MRSSITEEVQNSCVCFYFKCNFFVLECYLQSVLSWLKPKISSLAGSDWLGDQVKIRSLLALGSKEFGLSMLSLAQDRTNLGFRAKGSEI